MTEYKDVLRIHLNSESDASFLLRERQWALALDTNRLVAKLVGGSLVYFSPSSELLITEGTIPKGTATGLTDSIISEDSGAISIAGSLGVTGLVTSDVGVIAPGFATGLVIGTGSGQLISGRNLAISTSAHFAGPVTVSGRLSASDRITASSFGAADGVYHLDNFGGSNFLQYTGGVLNIYTNGSNGLQVNGLAVTIPGSLSVGTSATIPRVVVPVGGTFRNDGEAQIYTTSESGLVMIGRTGTSTNWVLVNNSSAGATVMDNPAGSLNVRFAGNIQTPYTDSGSHVQTNTLNVSGLGSFHNGIMLNGNIPSGSAGMIYGQDIGGTVIWSRSGSSYDFVIANSAGANVMSIAPSTRNVVFYGTVSAASNTFVGGGLNVSGVSYLLGNVNVNNAVDVSTYRVNVNDGHIATNNAFGFRAFSVGDPSQGNNEYVELRHGGVGSFARLLVDKNGSGEYRDLAFTLGGSERVRITSGGSTILGGTLNVSGAATISSALVGNAGIWSIRNGIGSTSTDGLSLDNATDATVDQKQISPRLRLTGRGWKSDATAGSQAVDWILENTPAAGTANPSTILSMASQINAGGFTNRLTLNSNGLVSIPNGSLNVGYQPTEAFPMNGVLDVRVQGDEAVIASFGEDDAPGYIYMSHINMINAGYNQNGNALLGINYRGYQGGTDQFRDLRIYDGKGTTIATFDGSSSVLRVKHSVSTDEPTLGVGGEIGFGGDYWLTSAPSGSGTDRPVTIMTPTYVKIKRWNGSAWVKQWIQVYDSEVTP